MKNKSKRKMKTVLFISDIHGSNEWKQIVHEHFYGVDDIVFLGDYVDSFTIQPIEQINNLKEIIKLKKDYPDKIKLLLGNHDYAYIFKFRGISGYNNLHEFDYAELFEKNWDLFEIAWGINYLDNYTLATHAGLTSKFLNDIYTEGYKNAIEIHDILNTIKDKKYILWRVGSARGGTQTPSVLWADDSELLDDPVKGINQVVGHTPLTQTYIQYNTSNNFLCFIDNRNYVNSIILNFIVN